MKKLRNLVVLLFWSHLVFGQGRDAATVLDFGKIPTPVGTVLNDSTSLIDKVPESFQFDPFYQKYLNVKGIPVVSSDKVPDAALYQARTTMLHMLERIPESVRIQIIENNVRVAIMAKDELTTAIPEHRDLNSAFPETNWDTRARGLGATIARPATSCAEENVLCYDNDRYRGEDILVHEFAHTIHGMGISFVEQDFDERLEKIFQEAKTAGLWENTYAMSNPSEYFAEGVQCWFNLNKESIPGDGIHNEINTRAELKDYDRALHDLINQYFSISNKKVSCHTANP